MHIDEAMIYDLSTFASQFQQQFEKHIGRETIHNIAILKYKLANGVATQIDVLISFNVPLSSNNLNDLMFPENWTFFEMIKQNHPRRSKYPMNNRQQMNSPKQKHPTRQRRVKK